MSIEVHSTKVSVRIYTFTGKRALLQISGGKNNVSYIGVLKKSVCIGGMNCFFVSLDLQISEKVSWELKLRLYWSFFFLSAL